MSLVRKLLPNGRLSRTVWLLTGVLAASGCGTSDDAPIARGRVDAVDTREDEETGGSDEQAALEPDSATGRPSTRMDSGSMRPERPSRTDAGADDTDFDDAGVAPDDVGTVGSDPDDSSDQEQGPAPTAESASRDETYQVKTYTSRYRNGPGYADSTIHYPEGIEGKLPAVSIVPGFVSPQASIRPWGPFLASHGIIAMTIGTNSTSDPPPTRANALLDALETLRTEDVRAGGPLNGRVDTTRLGVMGWSMGGGGALIAASRTASLKAAISMCGWNPGGQYRMMSVPSLMFAATSDQLAGGQSQGFYQSIPETTPKMLFEVAGGNHDIANNPRSLSGRIGLYGLS